MSTKTGMRIGAKAERVPPELEDVANQIGDFIEYWGFKKVHGRIWTHLYLSSEPLDAGHLMKRLGISKALASMSLADLLDYEVIISNGKSDRGTMTYEANPHVMTVISNVLRKRERRMVGRIAAAAKLLRDIPKDGRKNVPISQSRVKALIDLVRVAEDCLDGMLAMVGVNFKQLERFDRELPS